MRDTISDISSAIVIISIIGIFISAVFTVIRKVKKKNIKPTITSACCCIVAFIIFLIIGSVAWSGTNKGKESLEQARLEKEEKERQEVLEKEREKEQKKLEEEKGELGRQQKEEDNSQEEIQNSEYSEETEYKDLSEKNQFQSAVESIGMDYSQVKNIQNLDDWSSGKRYSFVYDGFRYIVYELGNGEIESINTEIKRAKIYERGYKPLNYKDFEPDINVLESIQPDMFEQLSQYIEGETSIKSKIGSMMYSRIYDYYSISGEVKAKNAVSKKDFTFTVDYIVKDGGYECVYLALDGAVAFGSDQTPELQKEELKQESDSRNGESIVLSYDKEGDYGKYDLFDGEPYLRYYVPTGNYKVKCNIRGGFYIETIELHKEDGWDTATTIQQINISEGEEVDIKIEDGQCISLIINTEIELIKQ